MFQPGPPKPEPSTVFRRAPTREEELPSVRVASELKRLADSSSMNKEMVE